MSYSMNDGLEVAKQAAADIDAWLSAQPETINVINVEDDPAFQSQDIDLILDNPEGWSFGGSQRRSLE